MSALPPLPPQSRPICHGGLLCCVTQWPKVLNASLLEVDPELFDIIEKEKNRQLKVTPHPPLPGML